MSVAPASITPHPTRVSVLLVGLLGLIAVCAYAPSMGGGFIFDDRLLIDGNPYIHSFSWWQRWFSHEFWDVGLTTFTQEQRLTYYRPLVTATYAVDWALGGGQPDLFHVTNLLWHAAACVLVFFTLRRWTGRPIPALLASLLFAVHPTRTESVAWISGRPDPICLVFLLIAVAGAARRLNGKRFGLALEVTGTLGAYLSKESALALPMLVAIETWVAAMRPPLDRGALRLLLRGALPQLFVALLYLGLRTAFLPLGKDVSMQRALTAYENRPKLVLETFGRALELVVLPRNLHVQRGLLTYDQDGHLLLSWPYVALGLAFLAALGVAIMRYRRRLPEVSLGLMLFLFAFLPTANVKPTGLQTIISDRFLYIPLLGIALLVATLVGKWLCSARAASIPFAAVGVAAALLALGSLSRAADYSDEDAYWTHELEVNPISVEAMRQKIGILAGQKRYDEALLWFQRAHATSRQFRDPRADLRLFVDALDLLSFLTPDSDHKNQRRLADFYQRLLDAQPGEARLVHPKARITITIRPFMRPLLEQSRAVLNLGKARLVSRMGNDAEAVHLMNDALRRCEDCRTLLAHAAPIYAVAGDYAAAHRSFARYIALTGEERGIERNIVLVGQAEQWAVAARNAPNRPAAIRARAMELSTLGCFGRAYAELEPYEADFINVPDVALGYAELAWRAGHAEAARRVLRVHLSEQQVAEKTARWDADLGRSKSGQ